MNQRLLRKCPIFQGIEDFSFVNRCLPIPEKTCIAGERLELTIGRKRYFGIVTSGRVTCDYGVYNPGDCFGLCFALTGKEHTVFTAPVKSGVAFIPAAVLTSPCEDNCLPRAALAANCLRLLAEELDLERSRGRLLSIHGIRQKLCAYLRLQMEESGRTMLYLPFNRQELADYLSVSRPSMSRELCALRDAGVLDFQGKTIKIFKSEELC